MKLGLVLIFFFANFVEAQSIDREQLSELHQIRSEIKNAVFDQSRYQQDILKSKLDIENQNQEMIKTQTDAEEIKEKIISRISNLYKIRRAFPQGSLLSFSKEEDFLRKSYYLKYLNGQDKMLVSEFNSKSEKTALLKSKIQSYMQRLVELQNRNKARFAELSARETRQRELIRQIRQEVQAQNQSSNTNTNLTSTEKIFFSELRGKLELPTNGVMSGEIGVFRDSKSKLTVLKTGIQFLPSSAADVRSVFHGKVLYSDTIPGWGPTVIIDHGESYYSVYSRLKNLSVRLGDQVLAQQKLAEVSTVPYHNQSSERGLYFEIRHYSEPQDPRLWFKGERQ